MQTRRPLRGRNVIRERRGIKRAAMQRGTGEGGGKMRISTFYLTEKPNLYYL